MTHTLKIGVIGTSWWADAMYLPALDHHPRATVECVVGRNPQRTMDFAERWGVPTYHMNYLDMYDKEDIDAVVISVPNHEHYPMAMAAFERGLHVLCEKPLALNYAQAKEMTEAAEAAGVKTMVPFTYRFMPTARYIKELIDDGFIGKPYHLNMRYYTGFGRTSDYVWRFDLEKTGAGVVGDLGTHWLYVARWMFGEIVAVNTTLGHNVERAPRPDGSSYATADDTAIMVIEFENGAQGVLHVTSVAYTGTPFGQTHHMEFHGSGGTLTTFTDWDTVQRVNGAQDGAGVVTDELPIPDHIWGTARRDTVHNTYKDVFRSGDFMARAFVTDILDERTPAPDFRDGLRIQQILDAAILSASEKRRVEVDEITA